MARSVGPGQFVHIKVTESLEPFFRRPFSVFRAKKQVEVLYEAVGKGTVALAKREPGEYLDILGPLGNQFCLPPKGTKQVVMIGGGIGVAPLMVLSDFLAKEKCEKILLYGARSKGHVFDLKDFKKNGCKVFVATDDGSYGVHGRVSELFNKIKTDPQTTAIYTCGPKPMMAAVKKFSEQNKLNCQASCEEVMACALGACLGCSIKTTKGYRTTCYDGPVFDIKEVIF